ncbi:MAG: hypothetical protein AB1652_01390 [Bacillota bacterium]
MTVDWGPFYAALIIVGLIGVLAGIFAGPLNRVIEKVEEKASGRITHHS